MIKVTIARWKYNNSEFRITKDSEYMECSLIAHNCAEAMRRIYDLKQNSNLAAFTPFEITKIEDI
jgi:hypothetical protein